MNLSHLISSFFAFGVLAGSLGCGSSSSDKPPATPGVAGAAGAGIGAGGATSSGGESSAGPIAGAAGAAPHIVSACPTGMAEVGKWTEITPAGVNIDPMFKGFNTGVNSFLIDPSNTATLYLGTCSQGLWKTTDCGANWIHVNTGTNGAEVDKGRNWTMAIDPHDPQVIYANSGYGAGGLWKSSNGGVDWVNLFPDDSEYAKSVAYAFVEFVAIDPTDHAHLVVSSHAQCTGVAAGPVCFAESNDSGSTWKMIKADPTMGFEAVGHVIINRKTWLQFSPFSGIYITQDEGATWTHQFTQFASNQAGELYKAADGNYYAPSYGGLLKSANGVDWAAVPNTPRSGSLAGDGTTLFLSVGDDSPPTAFWVGTGDFSVFTPYESPKFSRGSWLMRYDVDHKVLYTSNETGGFWRVQTK